MPIFYALISGIILALSQPIVVKSISEYPINNPKIFWVFALFAFVPTLHFLKKSSLKKSFMLGFSVGISYFFIVVFWILQTITHYTHINYFLALIILLLMSSVLALYWGGAFLLCRYLTTRFPLKIWYIFPIVFCAVEYFRNYYFFGGFPWGNIAYSQSGNLILAQSAAIFGIYGLCAYLALINCTIENLISWKKKLIYPSIITSVVITASLVLFGYYNLHRENKPSKNIRIAILQGNIDQNLKNQQWQHPDKILNIYKKMMKKAENLGAQLIVWPEASFPHSISPQYSSSLTSLENKTANIIGGLVLNYSTDKNNKLLKTTYTNSAVAIFSQGKLLDYYSKSHLVPFGEYVPWPLKSIVNKFVPIGTLNAGQKIKTILSLNNIDIGATICFEGVFPEISRYLSNQNAKVLVNLTNDAWYGISAAPYQHLNMYVFRAIENNIPYIRATNTGISAYIDSHGKINQPTKLFKRVVRIYDVKIGQQKTIYSIIGDIFAQGCVVISLVLLFIGLVGTNFLHRKRAITKWMQAAFGFIVFIWVAIIFTKTPIGADEAIASKCLIAIISSFLIICSSLSDKYWGKKTFIISAIILLILAIGQI